MRALLVECLRKDVEQRTSRLQSVQQIIRAVRRQLGGTLDDVAVTSPTGLAAPTCSLERAREAIRRYDWQAAYDLFCPEWSSLPAGDLSSFAEAAWWTGHLDVSTEAWEQAYTLHLSESNGLEAARAALHLSDNYESKLSHALANGWLARADRLLQKEEESPVHGWFLRALIKKDEADARFDDALEHAERMLETGVRLDDLDLQAMGIHYKGTALLKRGDVEEGMAFVEEAAVAAISGEIGPVLGHEFADPQAAAAPITVPGSALPTVPAHEPRRLPLYDFHSMAVKSDRVG